MRRVLRMVRVAADDAAHLRPDFRGKAAPTEDDVNFTERRDNRDLRMVLRLVQVVAVDALRWSTHEEVVA